MSLLWQVPACAPLWDTQSRYQPAICTSILPSLLRRGLNGRAAVIAIDVGRHAVGRVAGSGDLPACSVAEANGEASDLQDRERLKEGGHGRSEHRGFTAVVAGQRSDPKPCLSVARLGPLQRRDDPIRFGTRSNQIREP